MLFIFKRFRLILVVCGVWRWRSRGTLQAECIEPAARPSGYLCFRRTFPRTSNNCTDQFYLFIQVGTLFRKSVPEREKSQC